MRTRPRSAAKVQSIKRRNPIVDSTSNPSGDCRSVLAQLYYKSLNHNLLCPISDHDAAIRIQKLNFRRGLQRSSART